MYTSYYMNGNLKIPNIQSNALSTIKYMVIDIDGTLTDGGIYYDEQGNEFKKFNTKDAAGFFTAKACGIFTVVITGRRCQELPNQKWLLHPETPLRHREM